MPRLFTPIKINELQQKIQIAAKFHEDYEPDKNFTEYRTLTYQIEKDLSKVEFDCENFECTKQDHCPEAGYGVTSHGLAYLCCFAGGDWEQPIYFIIYWDGNKLRGYIPEKGNPWNKKTNVAFGNDEEKDQEYLDELGLTDFPLDNWSEIQKDIEARIVKK